MRAIAVTAAAGVLLVACGNAQVVHRSRTGGTLSLHGPRGKAYEDARKHMAQHCNGPYTVVEEGEVVVGTDTVHKDETYETEDGAVVNESGTSTRDATEWRVRYVCGNQPAGGAPPPTARQPAGEPPADPDDPGDGAAQGAGYGDVASDDEPYPEDDPAAGGGT